MGQKIKLIFAILLITLSVIVGITLGTWQIQRLVWKNDVITALDSAYNAPQALDLKEINEKQPEYIYGQLNGIFDYSKEIFLGPVTHNNVIAQQVITPLTMGQNTVFVVRGYLPIEDIDSYQTPENKKATVKGLMRKPSWNNFTSNNNPSDNIWTKPDIQEIAPHFNIKNVVPYFLYADQIIEEDPALLMPTERWYPRNKHAQYAVFWFGMSVVLVIFFSVIFIRRRREI